MAADDGLISALKTPPLLCERRGSAGRASDEGEPGLQQPFDGLADAFKT
jgi:hypothetical protein